MIRSITAFLIVLGTASLSAQNLEAVNSFYSFPTTTETNASTLDVEVYNPGIYSVEVVDIDFFDIYGNQVFSVSDTDFALFPQDTHSIQISFLPEHNILYQTAMVLKTRSGFGHLSIELQGQGQFSNSYYSSSQNLSEENLKQALKSAISSGYNSLGYTAARDNMYASIDNSGGQVECVYTGRTATFNTRAGANNNSFNCEHTFPQGKFNSNEPMHSDIHHLFPTDVSANSKRGNDPFDTVSNPNWNVGGSKSGGGYFEPRDVHKGSAARAMMYFVLRYQDYQNFFAPQENTLRVWHELFPPTAADKNRNNAISQLQNNRNPFVDYPQFLERIHNLSSTSSAPAVRRLYFSDDTINVRPGSGMYEYDFVVHNTGNQTINLSNFTFTDSSLSLSPGSSLNISVLPGESHTISIGYDASVNYFADFEFDTDIPGSFHQVIPLRSGGVIGLKEEVVDAFEIYPNPVNELLHIKSNALLSSVKIFNLNGQLAGEYTGHEISLGLYPSGIYFLLAETVDGRRFTKKLVIE